ncbi:UbiA family prenyltransferase [Streptomyces sp. NPDC057702]|uniref:UbiA family prenyltransferase n=1 Tax=unclassified Streptomyces TaxID=2593676 RepID=UPI0036B255BA
MAVDTTNPVRRNGRFHAYVKLGKFAFFDYDLCVLIVWCALPGPLLWEASTGATLLFFLVGQVAIFAATVTFDDLTGLRDGSDAQNYTPETGQLRDLARKPLLSGALTVRQAQVFGWGAVLVGTGCWGAAALVAPHRPGWLLVLLLVVAASAVQYSYGLKLSYRGGQEVLMIGTTGMVVLMPYALLTGEVSGLIGWETILFGAWALQVAAYSNMNDLEGDRKVGRVNVATMTSAKGYHAFLVAVSLIGLVSTVVAIAVDAVPGWFLLLLAPVFVLRGAQLRAGVVRGNPLAARMLGIQIHRLGAVLLCVGNLLYVHAS